MGLKKTLIRLGERGIRSKRFGRFVNTYFYFKNYSRSTSPLWPRGEDLSVQSKRFYDDNLLCGDAGIREKFRRLTLGLDDQSVKAAELFYQTELYIARHNCIPNNIWTIWGDSIPKYQIKLPPHIDPTEGVHLYDMGLKLIPEEILKGKRGMDIIDGGAY